MMHATPDCGRPYGHCGLVAELGPAFKHSGKRCAIKKSLLRSPSAVLIEDQHDRPFSP